MDNYESYRQIDAINYSSLKQILRSPAHYLYAKTHPSEPTTAMRLGIAVHMAVLEPERFKSNYAVFDGAIRRGEKWENFKRKYGEENILKTDEYESVEGMAASVAKHVNGNLFTEGSPEVVLLWRSFEFPCKGRADWIRNDGTLVGLKTARDASPHGFSRQAAELFYALQWGMYNTGYREVYGEEPKRVVEVVVETAPPYAVCVYDIPKEVLLDGYSQFCQALEMLDRCQRSNNWPSYNLDHCVELEMPAWAFEDRFESLPKGVVS